MVTGAAGFIGSHYVDYVLENNPEVQVIGFDCLTYAGNMNNLDLALSNKRFEFIRGDIRNSDEVNSVVAKVDMIVNFAAESHVDRSIANSQNFVETNILGVGNLLESAIYNKIKFFHQISTDEVYGSVENGFSTEKSILNPRSPYAASKAAADLLVNAFSVTHGLKTLITRASNNYGSRQYPEKIIPYFVHQLLLGKSLPIYGDGLQIRDWLHVSDHINAIAHSQKNLAGKSLIVNIPGNRLITNIDLSRKILKILALGEERISFVQDRKGHDRRYAMSGELLINSSFKHNLDFDVEFPKVIRHYYETYKNLQNE